MFPHTHIRQFRIANYGVLRDNVIMEQKSLSIYAKLMSLTELPGNKKEMKN